MLGFRCGELPSLLIKLNDSHPNRVIWVTVDYLEERLDGGVLNRPSAYTTMKFPLAA